MMRMKIVLFSMSFLLFVIVDAYSQTAEEYYKLGNEKLKKGDYDGAILNYGKAIDMNPIYAEAYMNRGRGKGRKGG